MSDRYAHILGFVLDHPWAITRPMLATIAGILSQRLAGETSSPEEINAALVQRKNLPQPRVGGVAVLPVYGVIVPRANMMSEMSGGTSIEKLSLGLRAALADPDVKTIVMDVDSPGGSVAGVTEFAREVLRARTKKPIVAVANFQMASAAYEIASAATEIVASPSSTVGSVGVYAIHDDLSKALAERGVTRTYISAGKFKTLGNETEPLTDEARAFMQARVDHAYDHFIADISKGRGVPQADVRAGFGEGRAVSAEEALKLGMIDRIADMHDTLARLTTQPQEGRMAATSQEPAMATDQERAQDYQWRNRVAKELFELNF